jgi:hypothetical protein
MVRMSRSDAPVGSSVPAIRIGTPGARIRATPTELRSHPIDLLVRVGMARA